jgi:hypothetical protein
MQVHQYKSNGLNIVLDVPSSSVHIADDLFYDAVELMGKGRKYTREELRKEIAGHLCRCTGYENILNALEKVVGYPKEQGGE